MRHRRQKRRLGLVREHRIALLRNLAIGLIEKGRIRTTYPRAKEASRFVDKLITLAKKKTLHARRQLIARLRSPLASKRLFDQIAPLFQEQAGGFTRVLHYDIRPGDGAEMAILELTKIVEPPKAEESEKDAKKKAKKKARKEAKKEAKEKAAKEAKEAKEEKAPKKSEAKSKPEKETAKAKEDASRQEAESKGKDKDKKADVPQQEEPKKGGFLGGLRKFLTGD
ncbi:MAG TPA: 50S ribosomal protein L17 [Candidatus Omnitrophota bacterium]|nr:50S ribosomal protein L17 [Candidatus Omnitrophota bacterium]